MHIDFRHPAPNTLSAQTCIIGAGAAGISLARHLLAAGQRVLLIESGGLDYEKETADLNAGENVGQEYYPLNHSRLRFFGGTTAIWGGRCAELDPIDFTRRDWVPYSGWPITHATLEPYYRQARRLLDLPAEPPTPEMLAAAGVTLPSFNPEKIQTLLWLFDGRFNRFTFDSCADLSKHSHCTILTHATVREIVVDTAGKHVAHLEVRSLDGASMRVTADHYVLAAGGIENPRLLLASNSVVPHGLGNASDQVGRYFMEHPHARGGRVESTKAWQLLKAFDCKHRIGATKLQALVTPSPSTQAARRLLNTSLTISARKPADGKDSLGMSAYKRAKDHMAPTRAGRAWWMRTKKLVNGITRYSDPLRPYLMAKAGSVDLALFVRAEQAPNPLSRVTLSDRRDALGMPRVRLDWRTTTLDVESVAGLVDVLGTELQRLGMGQTIPAPWLSDGSGQWQTDPLISTHPLGGYHHMGTTRMGDDPKTSVTDANCRVHGIDNLYVAGSSLFPTSGWANPTLTIIALALRLADHLKAK